MNLLSCIYSIYNWATCRCWQRMLYTPLYVITALLTVHSFRVSFFSFNEQMWAPLGTPAGSKHHHLRIQVLVKLATLPVSSCPFKGRMIAIDGYTTSKVMMDDGLWVSNGDWWGFTGHINPYMFGMWLGPVEQRRRRQILLYVLLSAVAMRCSSSLLLPFQRWLTE